MNCRVCGKSSLEPVIDLGNQPWRNGNKKDVIHFQIGR